MFIFNKTKSIEKRYVIIAEELIYLVITPNDENNVNSKWYIENYKEIAWAYSNPLSADELAKYLTYEFELGINTFWYNVLDLSTNSYLSEKDLRIISKKYKKIIQTEKKKLDTKWFWNSLNYNN